jgi:hypothetical protein
VTDDELIEAVRASLAGRRAPEPATQDVLEAEAAIGFPLPTVPRRLYLEVANGGFGPQFGVMGVRGHNYFTCYDYADIVESYGDGRDEDDEHGFPGLVWLLDWGCAIWSACDFQTPDGPMWGWDPNNCCTRHALFPRTRPSRTGSSTRSEPNTTSRSTTAASAAPGRLWSPNVDRRSGPKDEG